MLVQYLQKMAECASAQDLSDPANAMSVFGLQTAIWMVADGTTYEEMQAELDEAQGAMSDFFGGEMTLPEGFEDIEGMEELEGMDLEAMMEAAAQSFAMMGELADEWVDRCGVEPGQ